MKNSTLIYHEWAKLFEEMTDHDVKTVILALLDFDMSGKKTVPEFESNIISAIFEMMLEKTKKNRSLYLEKCEKNAKNGALGGRPKKTEKAKKADRKGMEGIGMEGIGMEESGNNSARAREDTHTPSLQEVKEFCASEGLTALDANRFWNYYESQHWLLDGQPMDWKARARLWNSQDKERKQPKTTEFQNFSQRDNDWAALEKELLKK